MTRAGGHSGVSSSRRRSPLLPSLALMLLLVAPVVPLSAGTFPIDHVTDMTPVTPLANPTQGSYESRYLSGFGVDDSFTILFEDRADSSTIKHNATTTGPTGFAAGNTTSNISDTHLVVKDWPITLASPPPTTCGQPPTQVDFAYRAWGAVGNSPDHHFYVSDDLSCWILVATFTIGNDAGFTGARGFVYYGFHDVIEINGTYYAWGESNQGQTMVVRSDEGDHVWEAFASIGGTEAADGPLQMPESATPSGCFFDLGDDRGIGKLHVRGDDSALLLAVNTAAQTSLDPAVLEAAFLDPANWSWHDGTTGLPTTPILAAGAGHDLREAWRVPTLDPADNLWTIVYTGDYGAPYNSALGYARVTVPVELQSFTIE